MNKHLKPHTAAILLAVGLLAFSCNVGDLDFDNIENPTFTPEVVAPIGEVTYTLKELLEEINDPSIEIHEANNLKLSIIYRDTSVYGTPEDLIKIQDVSQQKVIEPGITVTNTPVDVVEKFNQTISFEYSADNLEQIDSIMYSGGVLELTIASQISADVDVEIKLIDFVDMVTRDTIVFNSSLSYDGSLPVSDAHTQDLSGYRTKLKTSSDMNLFDVVINGAVNLKAGQSIEMSDFMLLSFSTGNTTFSGVAGYFGEDDIVIQDQVIDIEFFNDIEPGGLEFGDPKISVNFQNSFGVPIGISLSGLQSSNNNGDLRVLTGEITQTLQKMRAPAIKDYGETLGSSFVISNDNSNLGDLLSISPSRFTIPITASTNFENTDKEANFYTADSQVETIVEVNLPLDVKLGGYTQTFDFSLDSIDFDDADSLKLKVTIVNDLPFNGSFDLFLLDADSVVIHQVPENLILVSPEIGPDDRTIEAITNVEDVLLNSEGVLAMNSASKIVFVLTVDSYEADSDRFVRIFSDYQLTIKLGLIGNLRFTLE